MIRRHDETLILGRWRPPTLWSLGSVDGPKRPTIANVPLSRYRVRMLSQDQGKTTLSLPFEVVEGKDEEVVHWPELAP